MTRIWMSLVVLAFVWAVPTYAQEQKITQELVEAHFQKIVQLYQGEKADSEKIIEFTQQYVADDAIFKNSVTSNLSQKVIQRDLNKELLLKSLAESTKELYNAEAKYTVAEFKQNDDGSALVTYTFSLSGTGRMVIKGKGTFEIGLKSLSTCLETFSITDSVIKAHGSDCTIDSLYEKPVRIK